MRESNTLKRDVMYLNKLQNQNIRWQLPNLSKGWRVDLIADFW